MGACPKCNAENSRRTGLYCLPCHRAYWREHRPKHSELSEIARMKANARAYANNYKMRGKIKIMPCSVCDDDKAQMHHEDYSKPLEVIWLCRLCHEKLHGGDDKTAVHVEKSEFAVVTIRKVDKTIPENPPVCCACGQDHSRTGQRYCHACHAENMREWRRLKTQKEIKNGIAALVLKHVHHA